MSPHDLKLLLQHATGLDLSQQTVNAAARQRMKQRGDNDLDMYASEVFVDAAELQSLIELVVVPESWFFRDAEAFTAALSFVRHRLVEGKGPVRILSVPCAAGEEPYSIAIALSEAGIADGDFSIEAMDISRHALERAQRGLYQRNAFRTRDLSFRDRHFTVHGDSYQLQPLIRSKVGFHFSNLLAMDTQTVRNSFDLIFCRNLLIYFDDATQRTAIGKLEELLSNDGLLFSGYAETAAFCRHGFSMAPMSKAFALRKKGVPASQETPPLPTPRCKTTPVPMPQNPPPQSAPSNPPTPEVPEPADTLLARGRRLADEGKTAAAATAFRRYLQLVPDSAEAYFMLGLLSEHNQDDRVAEECLRRAIYLDPDHYDALCHLALLAERAGNRTGADNLRARARRVFRRRPEEQGSE